MQRKFYNQLVAWKNGGATKPLMVIGARQVGKTYLIREFCKNEYTNVIELNLTEHQEIVELFKKPISFADKASELRLYVGHELADKDTIVFFDEVQESEELITALKFFAESQTHYNIICAGSLLGVKIHRFRSSFPVGYVWQEHMYPMDFEEFLLATGNERFIDEIRKHFIDNSEMPDVIHDRLLKIYHTYLFCGGMPEAVADLIANENDVLRFNNDIQENIRNAYIEDMNKYIVAPLESSRIEAIYDSIPNQLGNKSRKFQYSNIRQGARARSYETALQWLVSSEMVYRAAMVGVPGFPLKMYKEDGYFKLFVSDVGLLANSLELSAKSIILDGDYSAKGIIAENYVAQQLTSMNIPLYYWRNQYQSEIDFLLQNDNGVVPVEVKAGTHKASPSLKFYREQYSPEYCIRISALNFGFANGIKSVPLYAVFCLSSN